MEDSSNSVSRRILRRLSSSFPVGTADVILMFFDDVLNLYISNAKDNI